MSDLLKHGLKVVSDFRMASKMESGDDWDASNIKSAKKDPGGYSFGGLQFNEENTLKFIKQLPDKLKKQIPASIRKKSKGMTFKEAKQVEKFFEDQLAADAEGFQKLQEDYAAVLTKPMRVRAERWYGDKWENIPEKVRQFAASVGVNMGWKGNQEYVLKQPLERLKASPGMVDDALTEMAIRRQVAIGRAPKMESSSRRKIKKNMLTHRTVEELEGELAFEPDAAWMQKTLSGLAERLGESIDRSGRQEINQLMSETQDSSTGEIIKAVNSLGGGE